MRVVAAEPDAARVSGWAEGDLTFQRSVEVALGAVDHQPDTHRAVIDAGADGIALQPGSQAHVVVVDQLRRLHQLAFTVEGAGHAAVALEQHGRGLDHVRGRHLVELEQGRHLAREEKVIAVRGRQHRVGAGATIADHPERAVADRHAVEARRVVDRAVVDLVKFQTLELVDLAVVILRERVGRTVVDACGAAGIRTVDLHPVVQESLGRRADEHGRRTVRGADLVQIGVRHGRHLAAGSIALAGHRPACHRDRAAV